MPREGAYEPGSPEDWLRRARSSLALAKQPRPPQALWEDLCSSAQQAAEKAVKAVLVSRASEFPKTHDIGRLLSLAQQTGVDVPVDLHRAAGLTAYALRARYPGNIEPATEEVHRRAVELAETVVRWAERVLDAP